MSIIDDPYQLGIQQDTRLVRNFVGCDACGICQVECPEKAIRVVRMSSYGRIFIDLKSCLGFICLRCERKCPKKVFKLKDTLGDAKITFRATK